MLEAIGNIIRRWRHTRGYGVHSPLGFRIVKDCIRPDKCYGFYCDALLDFDYHEDRKGLRIAKMAVRLIHSLRPKRLWMPGGDPRIARALASAMPGIRLATHSAPLKNADFIICSSGGNASAMWQTIKEGEECGMLIIGNNEDIFEGVSLEFTAKDFRILIRKQNMQKVRYEI